MARQESPSELPAAEGLEDHEGPAPLIGSHRGLMFGKDEGGGKLREAEALC